MKTKKFLPLSRFSVSKPPKWSCLVPKMPLTVDWKANILLQNQTEKQQANTMIHKLQADLITKKSGKNFSLKTSVSEQQYSVCHFIAD